MTFEKLYYVKLLFADKIKKKKSLFSEKKFCFLFNISFAANYSLLFHFILGCRKVLDIVLVVDGSDSISEPDFEKVKSSIAMLINQLDVEIDKIWFGLVLYSSDITEVVTLQQNKQKLLHRISLLKHARMGTNTALGIQTMDAMLGFGRPGVPKMGVVITDGISLDVAATHAAAVAAIKSGVSMFSVGIGNLINYGELQGIATGPGFVLNFTDFDQMSLDVIGRVASEICPSEYKLYFRYRNIHNY